MSDINTDEIREYIFTMLGNNGEIVSLASRIVNGEYQNGPMNGIDVHVISHTPMPNQNQKVLGSRTYDVPIDIALAMRYRLRDDLMKQADRLVSEIMSVLYSDMKLGKLVTYMQLPHVLSQSTLGRDDNPETLIYTITINYQSIITG